MGSVKDLPATAATARRHRRRLARATSGNRRRGVSAGLQNVVRVFDTRRMLEALTQVRAVVAGCVDAPAWSVSDDELVDSIDAVHQLEQAVAAMKLHLIREVDARALPVTSHATSTAGWLRERLRINIQSARRLVGLAKELDRRPGLDQALGTGLINAEQVAAVADTIADLPAELGTETVDKAEALLIDWAGQFEAQALRRLGTRILHHVAPEVADRADATAIARDYATRGFTLSPVDGGRVRLSGWLDAEAATTLTAALDPLCTPRRAGAPGEPGLPPDERSPAQRRADALIEVCQLALHTGELPVNGGDRPQLTVTVNFDALRRQIGAGTLDSGHRITPTQVRRLACDAQILPAVLGGQGQVLDLGQSRRLITGPLRRALVLRDRGCAFPGCDRPARWSEGHHIRSWLDGGPTSLANAVLLCRHHHRVIHHSDWTVRLAPDGFPEFLPPHYIDPHRRPRRNLYHQRQ